MSTVLRRRTPTYQARRERNPPGIPKKPAAPRGVRLGGVSPKAVRSDELLLDGLLQATEPIVVRTTNEADGSAVREWTNFTKYLSRVSYSGYYLSASYTHLDVFNMSLTWTPKEVEKIRGVLVSGRLRVCHSLPFGYLTRWRGEKDR